jgi:hypothetical protein
MSSAKNSSGEAALVLVSLMEMEAESPDEPVADTGCSIIAVVGAALVGPPGRRPIDMREVIETREALDPGRN